MTWDWSPLISLKQYAMSVWCGPSSRKLKVLTIAGSVDIPFNAKHYAETIRKKDFGYSHRESEWAEMFICQEVPLLRPSVAQDMSWKNCCVDTSWHLPSFKTGEVNILPLQSIGLTVGTQSRIQVATTDLCKIMETNAPQLGANNWHTQERYFHATERCPDIPRGLANLSPGWHMQEHTMSAGLGNHSIAH